MRFIYSYKLVESISTYQLPFSLGPTRESKDQIGMGYIVAIMNITYIVPWVSGFKDGRVWFFQKWTCEES